MSVTEKEKDLQAALAQIPAEYQEQFRAALRRELRAAAQDQSDETILAYLRQRQKDFQKGDYIRPDGRPATVALDPDQTYGVAMGELVADVVRPDAAAQEQRRLRLKIAGFALLVLLVLGVWALDRRRGLQPTTATATPAVADAEMATSGTDAPPTPTITAPTGADQALQTIGSLGAGLLLGRPSAIELQYANEEIVALPIDPSQVTPQGELRYNAAVMAAANPVAVWVYGTVLNYGLGVPPPLVAALQPGDRVWLHSDTGVTLPFVITATGTRGNHETNALLAQDRMGVTLFALPAAAADAVAVAIGRYDLAAETAATDVAQPPGTPLSLGEHTLTVATAVYSHTPTGELQVQLSGTGVVSDTDAFPMLSFVTPQHQSPLVPLPPGPTWTVTVTLPADLAGQGATAVLRTLPTGESALVTLGEVPDLFDQLDLSAPTAAWQPETAQAVVAVTVFNPGPGAVRLPADFMQIQREGGDAYRENLGESLYLDLGARRRLRLAFAPTAATALVRVGPHVWTVSGWAVQP